MSHAKNKVEWCVKKAEKEMKNGGKHRGLLKVKPNLAIARGHIEKAERNIKATLYLQKGGYTDWCSSTLFYSIYHCFLAILAKFGYESRNQECTFALIKSFIESSEIDIEKEDMETIAGMDVEEKQHSHKSIVNIREEYQYTTKLSLEDETLEELLALAKKILDKTKVIIEKS